MQYLKLLFIQLKMHLILGEAEQAESCPPCPGSCLGSVSVEGWKGPWRILGEDFNSLSHLPSPSLSPLPLRALRKEATFQSSPPGFSLITPRMSFWKWGSPFPARSHPTAQELGLRSPQHESCPRLEYFILVLKESLGFMM